MKKRMYRAVWIKDIRSEAIESRLGSGGLVFGIDVAKTDYFGVLMAVETGDHITIRWKQPEQR